MFFKTTIRQGKCITELSRNIEITKKNSKEMQKQMLDEFIMTINEIQDIEALNYPEKEKTHMRNTIIDNARTKYVTKLIELSNICQETTLQCT